MDISNEFKKFSDAHNEYLKIESSFERKIKSKIKFKFFIQYQPSDGLTIVEEDDARVCLLSECIDHIKKYGSFKKEDLRKYEI
jgi:hypothetical protein